MQFLRFLFLLMSLSITLGNTDKVFADTTLPVINTFTVSANQIQSGQLMGASWDIGLTVGYNLLISCGPGITVVKTDGTTLGCNSTIANNSISIDAIDFFVYNTYGSTQTVSLTLTPLDGNGAPVSSLSQTKTIQVTTEPNPFNAFTSTATSSSVYSYSPVTVSWEGKTGLGKVNFKINCVDNVIATSSYYQSGTVPMPCDTPIFSPDLSGVGTISLSALNRGGTDATLTLTILPGTGTGIYDGIHTLSLPLTIKTPSSVSSNLSFSSNTSTINSGGNATITWNVSNGIGFNINLNCYDGVSVSRVIGTTASNVPCTTLALTPPLSPIGSLSLSFTSTASIPVPVTITGLPQLNNGTYDGTQSKTVTLTINPTTSAMSTSTSITSTPTTPTATKKVVLLTKQLIKGSQNAEVKILQTYLSLDKSLYPEGSVTGFFGPATERAVQRFQVTYGLAKKGVVGYGQVGPKTRAKLNELLAK